MRVLQIHNQYRHGGGEDAVVRAEAELLRSAGHDVVTYYTRNPETWGKAATTFARAPWNAKASRAVGEVVRRYQPDVAHVHNTWFALTPATVAELHATGVPVVTTLHNYRLICANSNLFRDGAPCEKCVASHPWHGVTYRCYNGSILGSFQACATIALNRARETWDNAVDLYFALSRFSRDRFVAGGLPANRIRIKPHFVADPGARVRTPSASSTVVYVGRLASEKGAHVLIDAINRVDALDLLIIGDGDERERLQQRAGPRVSFAGELPPAEVRAAMLRARGLAFPSLSYETFGLVLIEAMAAGLPVVASNLGGTPDVVRPGCGELVPPGDTGAWASALEALVQADVDAMGQEARDHWRHRFSPDAALPMLEEGYEWAMKHARDTSPR